MLGRETTDAEFLDRLDKLHRGRSGSYGNPRLRQVDRFVPYTAVHASRGKRSRAEPIAALYEQGKAHHVGAFDALEDQMCMFTPDGFDGSPDHVDALVWGATELTEGSDASFRGIPKRETSPRRM